MVSGDRRVWLSVLKKIKNGEIRNPQNHQKYLFLNFEDFEGLKFEQKQKKMIAVTFTMVTSATRQRNARRF